MTAPDKLDAANAEVNAVFRECLIALDACIIQIEQMQGMFDDEDGMIQDALDLAEAAKEKAWGVM